MNSDGRLTEIDLLGPVRVSKAFLEAIIARGALAKIVNIASDAGRAGSSGETVYAGTKGGVIAFTNSLAREMARHPINSTSCVPGPTDTPLLRSAPDTLRESLANAIPFRRLATPEEIADAVVFFASDRARYVTGQVLSQRQWRSDDGGLNGGQRNQGEPCGDHWHL